MNNEVIVGITIDADGVPDLLRKMTEVAEALAAVPGVTVKKVNKERPEPTRQPEDIWGNVVDKVIKVADDQARRRGPRF